MIAKSKHRQRETKQRGNKAESRNSSSSAINYKPSRRAHCFSTMGISIRADLVTQINLPSVFDPATSSPLAAIRASLAAWLANVTRST
jgi:hypothetical protein